MIVFLDANVLFSAVYSPLGTCSLLFRLAKTGHFKLVTSAYVFHEADRNLQLKLQKPLILPKHVHVPSSAKPTACPIDLPAKDEQVFLDTLHARADVLLTGDRKHFGSYMNKPKLCRGLLIQTVSEFINGGPYA